MEPEDLKAVEDANVTVRIEPVPPATDAGSGGPSKVVTMPDKKTEPICWACVALGVGFICIGVGYILYEFKYRK